MGHVRSLSSSLDQNKKKLIYQFLLMGSGVLMELILSKYNFSFRLTCSLYPLSLSKFKVTLNSSLKTFDFCYEFTLQIEKWIGLLVVD